MLIYYTKPIKYTKEDKNDVLLIGLFYLHYHHLSCHSKRVCAHRRSTRINYFLVLVSNTKVERRIDYEILVLYILNIPNLKLLFGTRTGKLVTYLIVSQNGPWCFAMNMIQALRENNKRYSVIIKAKYIYCIKENVIDRIITREIHLEGIRIVRDLFSMNQTH
jgi:hypothetical protein